MFGPTIELIDRRNDLAAEEVSFYEGNDRAYEYCADELRDLIGRAKSAEAEV